MSEPLSSPVGNSEREYYADEMNKGWKARAEKAEAEAEAEAKRLRKALQNIADQHLRGQIDEDEVDDCDWEAGYEGCVNLARAALDAGKEE